MSELPLPDETAEISHSKSPAEKRFEQARASDRAAKLDQMLAKATEGINYHSGETMLRGTFGDAPYSLLKARDGYHIAMMCEETALHIHIALSGEILRSEESPNSIKPEPGTEDEVLTELTNGVNRFAKQYANVDGLIGVLEDDIS